MGTVNKGKLGIFGGTSLLNSQFFSDLKQKIVSTPFGKSVIHVDPTGKRNIVFIQRHHSDGDAGAEVYKQPHVINYRANITAMVEEGVDRILAICCVGSLSKNLTVGTMVIPDDYFYLFGPAVHCYDDYRGHCVPSIDKDLRKTIIDTLSENNFPNLHIDSAVYLQTTGPRFETKAEVRYLAKFGDVIGMTAASEAIVANENEKPYAIVAMIDNFAHGIEDQQLTLEQFKANVEKSKANVEKAVSLLLEKLL